MELKRVVITGIGTINPLGDNISDYFDNLDKGLSGAGMITRFDTSLFKTKFACEIKITIRVNTALTERRRESWTSIPVCPDSGQKTGK